MIYLKSIEFQQFFMKNRDKIKLTSFIEDLSIIKCIDISLI